MSFKVIIPSANAGNLAACVESIRRCEPGLAPHDVIVVDDGAKPGFSGDVRWVEGEKPFIFARNVNRGILAADSDVLVLNDDASLMTSGGLTALAEVARENPDYGVICPAITKAFIKSQEQREGAGLRDAGEDLAFPAVFIPRRTQRQLGLLDERFAGYGFEDDDYCRRAIRDGLKLGVFDGCLVEHLVRPSSFRSKPIAAKMEQNRRLFQSKWSEKSHLKPGVTLVVTSCGRPDLLKRTLESFVKFNTFPIARSIVVEDGPGFDLGPGLGSELPNLLHLTTPHKRGQLYSIDRAYSRVETEYIFHCEDDWEFFRPGFIEESIAILETWQMVFQVWVRNDTIFFTTTKILGIPTLDPKRNSCPTLTWNPALRRTSDYHRIGGNYARIVGVNHGVLTELRLSQHYKKLGFYAAVIPPAVRHIGEGRHVDGPRQESVWPGDARQRAPHVERQSERVRQGLQSVADRPAPRISRVRTPQVGGQVRLASEQPQAPGSRWGRRQVESSKALPAESAPDSN